MPRIVPAFVVALLAAVPLAAGSPPAQAAEAAVSYVLHYDPAAQTMAVALCLAQAHASVDFSLDAGTAADLQGFERDSGAPLDADDGRWRARDWRAGECLHYRAALARIAATQRPPASGANRVLVTAPQRWLLRVADAGDTEVSVELPAGTEISAPWQPLGAEGGVRRFRMPSTPPGWLARVAIGRFTEQPIVLPGGTLRVAIAGEVPKDERARLMHWLDGVARAALSAYGRLPLPDVQVLVIPVARQREAVVFGQSTRGQGHALTLFVDPAQPAPAFARDWVAVHELAHLMHPYLGDRGAWLAEGLASYYQNVLRARAGLIAETEAWRQLDDGFRRGRAATGSDAPPLQDGAAAMGARQDFQRIYWSGAAYWLEADIELRRSTANRIGVDEALRRFAACCLPSHAGWAPRAFVARLDALSGSDVFARTFEAFRARRDFPDLAPTYAALGLVRDRGVLSIASQAPELAVRAAIMRPRAQPADERRR